MARNEVGIVVSAQDKASAVLKKIGSESAAAFTKAQASAISMNQQLQLVGQVFQKLTQAVRSGVQASIELHGENNEAIKKFKEVETGVLNFSATIGDIFIPAIGGIGEAYQKATKGTESSTKKIISGLSTVIAGAAGGIGWAVTQAQKPMAALIGLIEGGVEGAKDAVDEAGKIADIYSGAANNAERLGKALQDVNALTKEQANLANQLIEGDKKALEERKKRHDDYVKKIKDAAEARDNAFADEYAKNQENENKRWQLISGTQDKITAYLDEQALKRTEITIRATNEEIEINQEAMRKISDSAIEIGTAYGAAFAQVIEGNRSMSNAMLVTTLEVTRRIIMAAAAEAAAKQIASASVFGVAGIAIGAAAAATVFAVVEAYAAKLAKGGVIRGGTMGVDSVPILAQSGERVLSVEQNRSFERLVALLESRSGVGGGVGGTVVIRSDVPPSDMDYRRAAKRLQEEQRKLARRGLI